MTWSFPFKFSLIWTSSDTASNGWLMTMHAVKICIDFNMTTKSEMKSWFFKMPRYKANFFPMQSAHRKSFAFTLMGPSLYNKDLSQRESISHWERGEWSTHWIHRYFHNSNMNQEMLLNIFSYMYILDGILVILALSKRYSYKHYKQKNYKITISKLVSLFY
jgi:hypothetical protein